MEALERNIKWACNDKFSAGNTSNLLVTKILPSGGNVFSEQHYISEALFANF